MVGSRNEVVGSRGGRGQEVVGVNGWWELRGGVMGGGGVKEWSSRV